MLPTLSQIYFTNGQYLLYGHLYIMYHAFHFLFFLSVSLIMGNGAAYANKRLAQFAIIFAQRKRSKLKIYK